VTRATGSPGHWKQLTTLYVVAVALHSAIVGLMLMLAPAWSASFGGWGTVTETFFIRQAGVFHLVVVCGYLVEWFSHRRLTFMVCTKSIAVLFLVAHAIVLGPGGPWAVPLSGAGDAAMAVVAALLARQLRTVGRG
jgi:hypothetical protein